MTHSDFQRYSLRLLQIVLIMSFILVSLFGCAFLQHFNTNAEILTNTSFPTISKIFPTERKDIFRFSTFYSDHMVLQKGTEGAVVWGYSSLIDDLVTITLNGVSVGQVKVQSKVQSKVGIWQLKIRAQGKGPYTMVAISSLGRLTLDDVLFGDVWLCAGQSNMEYGIRLLINATAELLDTAKYRNSIRILQIEHRQSDDPLEEFKVTNGWQIADNDLSTRYFSAVCWLYGKYLSHHLGYPIGLMKASWGMTRIESWSSAATLSKCPQKTIESEVANSVLWNAMIHPLSRISLYGIIWYQGESNVGAPEEYVCQFQALIKDWREVFYSNSVHQTAESLPFGFVQIAPSRSPNITNSPSYPRLRWSQTGDIGYVPNTQMHNTFMAVSIDLPDFDSPYLSIHPRYKHDVAKRLVLSSLAIAYKIPGIKFQGPYPTDIKLGTIREQKVIVIKYDDGSYPIEIRDKTGFQVCCSWQLGKECDVNRLDYGQWKSVDIIAHNTSSVTIPLDVCPNDIEDVYAVRYDWAESPCFNLRKCAVYTANTNLPAPQFIMQIKPDIKN